MKSIRVNTFETNSSSAHSLTFASKGSGVDRNGKLNWKKIGKIAKKGLSRALKFLKGFG